MLNYDLVSIVIPVFNVEAYLERCITSVRNQSYSLIEIILVDDGSTDQSGRICDEYSELDSRIKVVHQNNEGLSEARNRGVRESQGKFVCFLDADDVIDSEYVNVLHKAIVTNDSPLAMCAFNEISEKKRNIVLPYKSSKVVNEIFCISSEEFIDSFVKQKDFYTVAWNKMYAAWLVKSIPFPKGKVHEDQATIIQFIVAAKKMVIVNIPLYDYYINRQGSISSVFNEKACRDYLWARQVQYDSIVDYDSRYSSLARWLITESSINALLRYYFQKKVGENLITIKKELRKDIFEKAIKGEFSGIKTWCKVFVLLVMPYMTSLFNN